jgi:Domain of unknown function (DUF4276)
MADHEPLAVLEPIPAKRASLIKATHPELDGVIEESFRKVRARLRQPGDRGFILLLLDADEDCPKSLAEKLLGRARVVRSDADIACVLAKRELENWFKAAAASLAGVGGLPVDLQTPSDPESGSGDAWLTRQMQTKTRSRKYTKPADAVVLVQKMDLQECRTNSRSFQKLCKEFESRLPHAKPSPPSSETV